MPTIRNLTDAERAQGYICCTCGEYAHIIRAEVLRQLPEWYHGELCGECSCWMVAVDKLPRSEEGRDG